jgi:hypothetical protein
VKGLEWWRRGWTGIAGVMPNDVYGLKRVLDELDPRGDVFGYGSVAIGVLASSKTLRGEPNRYAARYPFREMINGIFQHFDPRLVNVLHIAADDPARCAEVLNLGLYLAGSRCDAVQVNVAWPELDELANLRLGGDHIVGVDFKVILQLGPTCLAPYIDGIAAHLAAHPSPDANGDRLCSCRELGELAARLAPYVKGPEPVVDAVLVDVSAGTGKPLDPRVAEAIVGFLEVELEDPPRLGVAGGLDGEAVPGLAQLVHRHPMTFLDAEGRLRDDAPYGGNLDLAKVRAYLAAVRDLRSRPWKHGGGHA